MQDLTRLLEDSLNFQYLEGRRFTATELDGSTGWRTLPFAVLQETRGSYLVEIAAPSGTLSHTLTEGEGMLIPPGVSHRVTICSPVPADSCWCHIRYSAFGESDLFRYLELPSRFSKRVRQEIGRITRRLQNPVAPSGTSAWYLAARRKALGFSLLATLVPSCRISPRLTQSLSSLERTLPVCEYIRRHLADPLTRGQLASLAHLSPVRFHVLFRAAMGMAPMEYVQKLRMEEARALLINTGIPIAEVGRKVGYEDPFHFSRLFRSLHQVSPLEYRRSSADWFPGAEQSDRKKKPGSMVCSGCSE